MNKKFIRILIAIAAGLLAVFITAFLGYSVIIKVLGDTAYAVKAPLLPFLCLISAIATMFIFFTGGIFGEEMYDEEDTEEEFISNVSEIAPSTGEELEEYPEFSRRISAEVSEPITRPDIKKIIEEQKGSVASEENETILEEDDYLSSFKPKAPVTADSDPIYDNIPSELPENYVPYEEDEEDVTDEEDEEEYEYSLRISPIGVRIFIALLCCVLAVILPINTATVYSPDKITVRRPFSVKEYSLSDAESYTVSVKLSGDVSMKVRFSDGTEKELICSSYDVISDQFDSNYSSAYGYAAFCDRLMKKKGITKHIGDLTSLSPSLALSEKDLAYIEEITETKLDINN